MPRFQRCVLSAVSMLTCTLLAAATARADDAAIPEAIAAPGLAAIATLHAEGAQIYECKPNAEGRLEHPPIMLQRILRR